MDNFSNKFRFRFNNDFFTEPIETDNFVIYQIGDLFCDYDTVIDDHTQDMQIELSFVENGAGVISSNGVPTAVTKGDIYLTLEGDVHRISSGNVDTMRFFYIAFNIKPASPLSGVNACFRARHADPAERVFCFPYIFPQMTNILSEITYRNEFYRQLIDDNLSQIVISLYRNATRQLTSFNKYQIDSRKGMIYNIAHYISNNLRSIVSLSDLAETFSYDYSYISKRFKQVMGQSMQSFFQQKKLEYASALLAQEHKSVTAVAEILNYSSIHNFSRAFKNYYGVPPQVFLEKLKSDKNDPPPA